MHRLTVLCLGSWLALGPHAAQSDPADTLSSDGRFNRFAEAMHDVGVGAERPSTIFAPTDEAFRRLSDALEDALFDPDSRDVLKTVVEMHIVPGAQYSSTSIPVEMTTLGGTRLVATATRGALTIRPAPEDAGGDAALQARALNEARVRVGDIAAGGSIVHGIDRVLVPANLDERLDASDAEKPVSDNGGEDYSKVIAAVDGDRGNRDELAATVDRAMRAPDRAPAGIETDPQPNTDKRSAAVRERRQVQLPADIVPPREAQGESHAARPEGTEPPSISARDAHAPEAAPAAGLGLAAQDISLADLLGADVADEDGEVIGEVVDVRLALDTGRAERFVVEIDSGLLDLFGKRRQVPAESVSVDPLEGRLVVPREALDAGEQDGGG